MSKKIGIALVVLGALVIVLFFAQNLSQTASLGIDSSFGPGMADRGGSLKVPSEAGIPTRSLSFSNPLPSAPAEMMEGAVPVESDTVSVEKKEIKNGSLELKVDRTDQATEEIAAIARANGGEVANSNFYQNATKVKSGSLTVKVPVANFEKTFAEIKKVATLVVRESTSGTDVTREYTDLQSRLKNKQAEEQSILKIMERAGTMEDVLKVTRELNRVRGEIEMLQGQIRFLESQTDLAQINISLSEDPEIAMIDSWRPWQLVKDSVNNLVKGFQRFIDFVIILLITILPILLLYFILIYILYSLGKKAYLRWKAKKEQSQ